MHSKTVTKRIPVSGTTRFKSEAQKTKLEQAYKEMSDLQSQASDKTDEASKVRLRTGRWGHDQLKELKELKKKLIE